MHWLGLALTAETAVFTLAGFSWFRSRGYTYAEAGAGAVLALFMFLSLAHQLSSLLGSALPGFILESTVLATLVSLGLRRRSWSHLSRALSAVIQLLREETFSSLILATAWSGMAVATVFLSYDPQLGAELGTHSWDGWMMGPLSGALLTPLNIQALFYHTGRFGLAPGACGFGLLAHMAVGFSTYALARRYVWPPMALTVASMVLSMPRLVFLGIRPTAELVSAAAIIFSLVLLYRLVEQHRPCDLLLFLLCLLFSIHAAPMSLALVLVLALLLVVVMIRRHGWIVWREMLVAKPLWTFLVLVPVLALAQIPVLLLNFTHGHPLLGTTNTVADNGLLGGAINLMRYLLMSIDPTDPVRQALLLLAGVDLKFLLSGIYAFSIAQLAGHAPGSAVFTPIFSGSGVTGFGPFIPLLVLPAMVHAFLRGPRRLKALGVAWGGYCYLTALMVTWQPDGLSVLTPLYAANGFVVAFSLPPHRLRRRGMRLLQTLFALQMAFSLYLSS